MYLAELKCYACKQTHNGFANICFLRTQIHTHPYTKRDMQHACYVHLLLHFFAASNATSLIKIKIKVKIIFINNTHTDFEIFFQSSKQLNYVRMNFYVLTRKLFYWVFGLRTSVITFIFSRLEKKNYVTLLGIIMTINPKVKKIGLSSR